MRHVLKHRRSQQPARGLDPTATDWSSCVMVNDGTDAEQRYTLLDTFSLLTGRGELILIDGNGQVRERWSAILPGANPLPSGTILAGLPYERDPSAPISPTTMLEADRVVEMKRDGTFVWSTDGASHPFAIDDKGRPTLRAHHEFRRFGVPVYDSPDFLKGVDQMVTLVLAHESPAMDESRNVSTSEPILDSVLYELAADGRTITWQWAARDHIEQMGFTSLQRQAICETKGGGSLSFLKGKFPGLKLLLPLLAPLIGLPQLPSNLVADERSDWLNLNAASYLGPNPWCKDVPTATCDERFHPDNILVSSRNASLLFIIAKHDHSAGRWKQGDIVWHLGPTFENQEFGPLIGQHHAHLIPQGLPGAGHLLIFDNGGASGYGMKQHHKPTNMYYTRGYTRILEIDPVQKKVMWAYGQPQNTADPGQTFLSAFVGSAQRLANGHTLINAGAHGRVFEIDTTSKIVWEFWSPFGTFSPGKTRLPFGNLVYRAYRVSEAWVRQMQ